MRILNRVLAVALGLLVVVAGVLVALEVLVGGLGYDPVLVPYDRWYRSLQRTPWADIAVRSRFLLIALAGLLLIALQLIRRRPQHVALEGREGQAPADIDRLSLERSLARAARSVEGITGAKAKLRSGQVRVLATSSRTDAGGLQPQVVDRVTTRLRDLHLAEPPRVVAAIRTRSVP